MTKWTYLTKKFIFLSPTNLGIALQQIKSLQWQAQNVREVHVYLKTVLIHTPGFINHTDTFWTPILLKTPKSRLSTLSISGFIFERG